MSFCGYGQQVKIICDVPGDGGGWGRERVLGAEALQYAPASLSILSFPFHGHGGSPCRGVSAAGRSDLVLTKSKRSQISLRGFLPCAHQPRQPLCSSSTGRALCGAGLTLKLQGLGAGDRTQLQVALV